MRLKTWFCDLNLQKLAKLRPKEKIGHYVRFCLFRRNVCNCVLSCFFFRKFSYFYHFSLHSCVIGKSPILPETISWSHVKMASKRTLADFGFSGGKKRLWEGQATSPRLHQKSFPRNPKGDCWLLCWLKEFSWLRVWDGLMFCAILKSCPSMAGESDFVSTGCISCKRESVTIHQSSLNETRALKVYSVSVKVKIPPMATKIWSWWLKFEYGDQN